MQAVLYQPELKLTTVGLRAMWCNAALQCDSPHRAKGLDMISLDSKRQLKGNCQQGMRVCQTCFDCYSGNVEVSDTSSIDMIFVLAWCMACQIRIRVEHDIR